MKKKLKKVVSLVMVAALAMALLLMAGCGDDSSSTSAAADGSAEVEVAASDTTTEAPAEGTLFSMIDPDEEYIVISMLNNIEYWNAVKYGWEMYADLYGVQVSFMGPADDNVNDMVSAFETAIAKNPAGICVWGYDEAAEPYIEQCNELGIPCITYINDIGDARSTYVGSSAYELGYTGGKAYADMIGGSGQVAILSITGNDSFVERQQGFEAAFEEYPDIEVVAIGDTKADQNTAISVAKDIAVKYPDLNGFVCCDSTGANGASTALSELGLTGEVDVIGLDRNTDVLQAVKDGTTTATLCQDDVAIPYWCLTVLIAAAHVDFPISSDNAAAGANVLPTTIYTPVNFITQDNVDYYLDMNEIYATNDL